jgi:hypothetical protein
MIVLIRRRSLGCFLTVLVFAAALAGCSNQETGKALKEPSPSPQQLPPVQMTVEPIVEQAVAQTVVPTPTRLVLGPLFDAKLDLRAGPVDVPLELQIPALKVTAPMLGVGLAKDNNMDAPKGPIGDPVWHTAFWYRGSGNPGESGTATVAGHVNDPLGRPEIFAHLEKLQPGDLVIVRYTLSNIEIRFKVDQVKDYSIQESSDPAVIAQIFGVGPASGAGPQPAPDGLSHLTLITCAGNIVKGAFDHHMVVYATRSQ